MSVATSCLNREGLEPKGYGFKHVSFARGSKTGPSTDWIRCLLGGPLLSPPKHLLQLCCSFLETHQTNTELAIRASNKGGPNSVYKNHINFRYQKRTQNLPLVPACLGHDNLSLSVLLMKEVPCFQSLQSRRFEARRGLAEATPRTQKSTAKHPNGLTTQCGTNDIWSQGQVSPCHNCGRTQSQLSHWKHPPPMRWKTVISAGPSWHLQPCQLPHCQRVHSSRH